MHACAKKFKLLYFGLIILLKVNAPFQAIGMIFEITISALSSVKYFHGSFGSLRRRRLENVCHVGYNFRNILYVFHEVKVNTD